VKNVKVTVTFAPITINLLHQITLMFVLLVKVRDLLVIVESIIMMKYNTGAKMNEKELLIKCVKDSRYPVNTLMNKYGFTMSQLQQIKENAPTT